MAVKDAHGDDVGKAVEALVECDTGAVGYIVIATGGIGGIAEELRPVPRNRVSFGCDYLELRISRRAFAALAPLAAGDWPAYVPDQANAA